MSAAACMDLDDILTSMTATTTGSKKPSSSSSSVYYRDDLPAGFWTEQKIEADRRVEKKVQEQYQRKEADRKRQLDDEQRRCRYQMAEAAEEQRVLRLQREQEAAQTAVQVQAQAKQDKKQNSKTAVMATSSAASSAASAAPPVHTAPPPPSRSSSKKHNKQQCYHFDDANCECARTSKRRLACSKAGCSYYKEVHKHM